MAAFEDVFIPFWNQKNLEPPPSGSFKIKSMNPGQTSANLANDFNNIISVLENQDLLHIDAALISRLLYRTRMSLRNDKGYKGFQKVYRILRNYLSLNILKVVTENRFATYNDKGPSKEMLEWCLISLQRFATLFCRLEKTCMETAYYLHNQIRTGNRWNLALLFLACLSRVWTLSRYLLLLICEWYTQLKSYLSSLESNGRWLPLGYKLPDNLQLWLGNPDFLSKQSRKEVIIEKSNTSREPKKSSTCDGLLFNEDFGEIISRDNGSLASGSENINVFIKAEDIEKFIRNEEINRRKKKRSPSSNLNDKDWNYLRNYLNKCLKEITTNKDKNIFHESMNRARNKMRSWLQYDK